MCLNIASFGIASSAVRFCSDFLGDWSTDVSTAAHVPCREECLLCGIVSSHIPYALSSMWTSMCPNLTNKPLFNTAGARDVWGRWGCPRIFACRNRARMMPLVGRFSRISPASLLPCILALLHTRISSPDFGSEDLYVKSRPNIFTPLLYDMSEKRMTSAAPTPEILGEAASEPKHFRVYESGRRVVTCARVYRERWKGVCVCVCVCLWTLTVSGGPTRKQTSLLSDRNATSHDNWVVARATFYQLSTIYRGELDIVGRTRYANKISAVERDKEGRKEVEEWGGKERQREQENPPHSQHLEKVRLLASHQGEPGSIPGRVTPGFSQVVIVPDDGAGSRVFPGISRFPSPCIPVLLHSRLFNLIGSQDLDIWNYRPSIVTNFAGRMSLSAPVKVYAGKGSDFFLRNMLTNHLNGSIQNLLHEIDSTSAEGRSVSGRPGKVDWGADPSLFHPCEDFSAFFFSMIRCAQRPGTREDFKSIKFAKNRTEENKRVEVEQNYKNCDTKRTEIQVCQHGALNASHSAHLPNVTSFHLVELSAHSFVLGKRGAWRPKNWASSSTFSLPENVSEVRSVLEHNRAVAIGMHLTAKDIANGNATQEKNRCDVLTQPVYFEQEVTAIGTRPRLLRPCTEQDMSFSGAIFTVTRTTVVERLACSLPTKAIRVQYLAGSIQIFPSGNRARRCRWSDGFLGDLSFPPSLSFQRCSILTSITLIGSQDLDVKSRLNLFTSLAHCTSFPNLLTT
ncbi:hypothetical protein PR048_027597 [Dryococelus australis]|uniref:Uncharacterized protein n=1 Tax=Dryococelus australis TaxID=614101 RepID=A0ABQ9GGZ2_9NEOP|nr:hypothetical protein PR048_027597 [Dryococelus australis]